MNPWNSFFFHAVMNVNNPEISKGISIPFNISAAQNRSNNFGRLRICCNQFGPLCAVNIQSKVLAFAFGLSAEIERNLISQRTKEALARKKSEGVVLGRPIGKKSAKVKLSGKEDVIRELLIQGVPKTKIAEIFKVNRMTLAKFIKERM